MRVGADLRVRPQGPGQTHRAASTQYFLLAALLTLATACGQAGPPPFDPAPKPGLVQPPSGQLTAALPAADLAVGQDQRFLVALIGPDNQLVTDAQVELAFFKVTGSNTAQMRSRAPAAFYPSQGLQGRGIYVARAGFDEPGDWGVAAVVQRPGQETAELRVSFQVKARSATPAIGEAAPPSRTLTGRTAEEVERFSSARPVDLSLYRVSVGEALTQGKPLLLLFATPGFCTSRTCGPSLEALQALRDEFRELANFIHVEIFKDAKPGPVVPAVEEWRLPSEPWLFVVDANGRVADKFEGAITVEEVRPRLARILGVE